jgi:hypothetical protein
MDVDERAQLAPPANPSLLPSYSTSQVVTMAFPLGARKKLIRARVGRPRVPVPYNSSPFRRPRANRLTNIAKDVRLGSLWVDIIHPSQHAR